MKFFEIFPLSKFRIESSAYPYNAPGNLVPNEHLTSFQYEKSYENQPYRKIRIFIEPKAAAIDCGDFTNY